MAITKVKSGKGLVGGGSAPVVELRVDETLVPLLHSKNEFKGNQKVDGSLRVEGDFSAKTLEVDSTLQVPKLNATLLGGTPLSGLARLSASNTFHAGQTVQGPLAVSSVTGAAGTFEGISSSHPGIVATGGDSGEELSRESIPDGGPGVVGFGGYQTGRGLGAGGVGVYGEGGEKHGPGSGGAGVIGSGGNGGEEFVGGPGGGFQGGTSRNGSGGTGVRCEGGWVMPPTRDLQGAFYEAGDGIVASGGYSYAPGMRAGTGGLFFGGYGQFGPGAAGVFAVRGYSGLGPDRYGHAGVFQGDVWVQGTVVADDKKFEIDHPLDPESKVLSHACVESSERMTIYSGNVVLGPKGRAVVELPDWFEALNADLRYQLTPIGASASLFVETEVRRGRFTVAGGLPGQKVSWQITAIRHDRWARANPLEVESEKPQGERGFYLHPEAHGADVRRGLGWARSPGLMKRIAERREEQEKGKAGGASRDGTNPVRRARRRG